MRSKSFRSWLTHCFYNETGKAPNAEALQSALNTIEAKACFDSPEHPVLCRIGRHDDRLYLDLCDPDWNVVEIGPDGWQVIASPPVRFRRSKGMKSLPVPEAGGYVRHLERFLNIGSDDNFALVVAWLVAALRDRGPYPVLVLSGEQGSAKSTFSAMLRSLVDPNHASLRSTPRDERDLFIATRNGHILSFDNLSRVPGWFSDALCRVATGGSFALRKLHTDQDEVFFQAANPVILNGIEDVVTRSDLASRAIFLTLQPIPDADRQTEAELWSAFNKAKPYLLGALLDAVSGGLRRLPETELSAKPRMADFALWATACETAFWPEGRFMAAYDGNRARAEQDLITSDPVGSAICDLLQDERDWRGTATDLLSALTARIGEQIAQSKAWPKTAQTLSGSLRRLAPVLRKTGIEITTGLREGRNRNRIVELRLLDNDSDQTEREIAPSVPSAASARELKPSEFSSLPTRQERTQRLEADDADNAAEVGVHPNALTNLEKNDADDADDADAKRANRSEARRTDLSQKERKT